MKKNMLLLGAAAVAGFMALTAFGAKTLEQQKAEIQEKIEMQLNEVRVEEAAKCNARVSAEATNRYNAYLQSIPAEPAETAAKGVKKAPAKTTKKSAGPKVDPLPQTPRPTAPVTDDQKAQSRTQGQGGADQEQKAKSRIQGAPSTDEQKAKSRIGGGGK